MAQLQNEYIRLVWTILLQEPDLVYFYESCGLRAFKDKEGESVFLMSQVMNTSTWKYDYKDTRPSFKPLNDFLDKWKDCLRDTDVDDICRRSKPEHVLVNSRVSDET